MDDENRSRIDVAFLAISLLLSGHDAAFYSLVKTRIDLHRGEHQQRIAGDEEHARWRRCVRAVGRIKNTVAEDAMALHVVGNCQIEGLIEVVELLRRLADDCNSQDHKSRNGEDEPRGGARGWLQHGHTIDVADEPSINKSSTCR